MGIRFRKSVRIFPGFRVNFSTRGVSASVGGAPFTLNISKKGVCSTTSIPGTGISLVHQHGGRWRASNSPLQLRPAIESEPADVSRISRKTRKVLDRYLALELKEIRQEADGAKCAFDLHCRDCGGYQLEAPEGLEDHHVAYCRACGIKFGMMGEIRAYADEQAAAHFVVLQQREAAARATRRREIVSGILAIVALGGAGWWWFHARPQPGAAPLAVYSAPVALPPGRPLDPTSAVESQSAPSPVLPMEPQPTAVIAPLPPPRPPSL